MWASILASILKILESIFGSWKTKEEIKKKEFEVKNTEEVVRIEKIKVDTKVKDQAETLVKNVKNSKDEARKKYLDEIRKQVGG